MLKRPAFIATIAAALGFVSYQAHALFDTDMNGVVIEVLTYTDTDTIYFKLNNQPLTHQACGPQYFTIPAATLPDRRKALLARLLLAKATGETIHIGFDGHGNCSDGGYIRAHNVG